MKTLYSVICVLMFAVTALGQKDQPLPKDLPPYGPEKPLQTPQVKTMKLDNGLTVWLAPQPGLPKVSFVLEVRGGLAQDPKDKPGVSELLARTLTQGTKTRTGRQIAEEMQGAGADLAAAARREFLQVTTTMLSGKVNDGLTVFADVAQNATFPDAEVAIAKRNLSNTIDQRESTPTFQATRALAKVMFGDGPYSVIGATKPAVAGMTTDDVRKEYVRRFRPDQAILVVVGDFTSDVMATLVREKLGSWRAPADPPVTPASAPSTNLEHAIYFVARPQSVQTTIRVGSFGPRRTDPDYEAVEVADAIFGGTFGSRLTTNIREDKGYTYSPGSALETMRTAGMFRTAADVRNEVTGASLNEIFYEMNRMVTTSPTDRELQQAKRALLGFTAIQLQSRGAVARELADLWSYDLPPEEIGAEGQKINSVTAADVDAAARKYFSASRSAVVTVGEEKIIREALAPFGLPIRPAP